MTAGGVRCALMRGGTSKGAVFLASDLPDDVAERDRLLLAIMGSPDPRQIDGIGGAHPLTSKVCVVSSSPDDDADVDYLFLQVVVDRPVVSDSQTCGNMLAAVAPFAIERGLVPADDAVTDVRVRLVNTGTTAVLRVQTPSGRPTYAGHVAITGVPGTAAPVEIVADPPSRPVLPTGRATDVLAGYDVTCVDNGMPSVIIDARSLGLTGDEDPSSLEADDRVRAQVRAIRAEAAVAMGLEPDVDTTTVPKIVIVSAPRHGGSISTRSFIPNRVHEAIGVLGAASVAAAIRVPGSVAQGVAEGPERDQPLRIEHPTGFLDVLVGEGRDGQDVGTTSVIRTARMLFDGTVYPRTTVTDESVHPTEEIPR